MEFTINTYQKIQTVEKALLETEHFKKRVFDSSRMPIVIIDACTYRFIDCNPAAVEIYGYSSKQETLGKTPIDVSPVKQNDGTSSAAKAEYYMGTARQHGSVVFEWRHQRPNGELWDAEVHLLSFTIGERELMQFSLFDITERKRAEEELQASKRRAVQQRSAIAALVLDHDIADGNLIGGLKYITEILASTIGVARASIWKLSSDRAELHCLTLYEAATETHSCGTVIKTNIFPHYFDAIMAENRVYAEDALHDPRTKALAESYLAPLSITSMLDAGILIEGRLIGVVCLEHIGVMRKWYPEEESFVSTCAAIIGQMMVNNERRKVEQEREKLQAQLIQAQKMESIGRLAGGVAHDFNNILSAIMGNTEVALFKLGDDHPAAPYLNEIKKAANRSADLTRQLLAFARKQTVTPKRINLNETVEGMLKMLVRLIGENIELAWAPGNTAGNIHIDPSQLDQILVNLSINARDAITDTGKITIETGATVFEQSPCAGIEYFLPGCYTFIAVKDTGCGMDQETLKHLFEPFFTTKERGKGTGLGLATIYGIIRQNNGFITVQSEPDNGSVFTVYLPQHTEKSTASSDSDVVPRLNNCQKTILLVEDEKAILDITKVLLEQLGYRVFAAEAPAEAINIAHTPDTQIDLLLTDVIMPGMNGRDLANNLLADNTNLKCIFMSGYPADVIAHKGMLDDGVYFIHKPFSIHELSNTINQVLHRQTESDYSCS